MSILSRLGESTPISEIKYRVGSVYDKENGKGTVLSYVDARYVQDTLDRIVGPENWESRFYEAKGALFCEITINEDGVKISKSDCGTESDIAPAKGEASDAFKRAAVMFGIGRDLYSAETMFADLEKKGLKWVLPRGWKPNDKPKIIPKINLKDQEVKIDVVAFADKVLTPPSSDVWDGSETVGYKTGNNVGKTYKQIDAPSLKWIITDCKNQGWKEKAQLELKRRGISG